MEVSINVVTVLVESVVVTVLLSVTVAVPVSGRATVRVVVGVTSVGVTLRQEHACETAEEAKLARSGGRARFCFAWPGGPRWRKWSRSWS